MSTRLIGAGVLAVVLGVAVVGAIQYLGQKGQEPKPLANTPTPAPVEKPSEPVNRVAKSFVVDVDKVPLEDRFELPDGTWALALNGVKNPGPLNWPRDRPWAPIVERRMGQDGMERYRHADNSWSWNQLQYRQDLGRMDSITCLANPAPTVPMEDLSSPKK